MAFLNPFWEWIIIDVFSFVGNYGLRIVLFIVILKLILAPLDFYNRKKSKDNARIMVKMKPELEKLEKQFGDNPQEMMVRRRALNKKYGHKMGASCITIIISMLVFLTLWSALTEISRDMNIASYNALSEAYNTSIAQTEGEYALVAAESDEFYDDYIESFIADRVSKDSAADKDAARVDAIAELDAVYSWTATPVFTDANTSSGGEYQKLYNAIRIYIAQQAVLKDFEENQRQSFLWVQNIWRPDTNTQPIPSVKDYQSLSGLSNLDETRYNITMKSVLAEYNNKWNGWFILVALTVILNFINQRSAMKMQQQSGETQQLGGMAGSMKMMQYIMPIVFGIFAFSYASAFTLYMVINAFMTLLITTTSMLILNAREKRIRQKEAVAMMTGKSGAKIVDAKIVKNKKK